MKFHNGCWLMKEGYTCFNPTMVYETIIHDDEVILYMPVKKIVTKGDTLDGMMLTMSITAPTKNSLRIQFYHYKGILKKEPHFDLHLDSQKLNIKQRGDKIRIGNGNLTLSVHLDNCHMTLRRNGELLTKWNEKDLCYIREDWTGPSYEKGQQAYIAQYLGLLVGEKIYGLGERFTPFVKNGQSVEIWNRDGGTNSEQSYKNIPFYLSSKGYGVFVNHSEQVDFEIGTEMVSKTGISVKGEKLDYFLIDGPSLKDVLIHYTDLTGKPALPPKWSFGLWLSTSFTTDYDEKTVMSFIDGMIERKIPLSVFHFDCLWMKEFHWTDFEFDNRVFPDPVGLLKKIKDKGIKVCVWINPYIAQQSKLFDEGMQKGYFIKRKNGDVWQWDMWQPGLAIVDFTNPEAKNWYLSHLSRLVDMGVDCFKTDFGERIPTDCVYYDHSDPYKMHNYYTYLYNQAVFDFLKKKKGENDAIVFARSATAGGQKFPVHWGGDCYSNYEAMSESIRGGLSLTSSGFGFWSHDIGGFEQTSTPDVYKRWAAFGLLSSHSRLHGSSSYRVPWLYGEEAVDVVRYFTKLKLSLLPYIYSEAMNTHLTGIPMMRSMAIEFQNDSNCCYLDRQYMLGDSLLVAPIFNEASQSDYYLPQGNWYNFFTHKYKHGGLWMNEYCSYLEIPLWVKENSIIARSSKQENASDSYTETLELEVFGLTDSIHKIIYEDGKEICKVSLQRKNQEVIIHMEHDHSVTIKLIEADTEKEVIMAKNEKDLIIHL